MSDTTLNLYAFPRYDTLNLLVRDGEMSVKLILAKTVQDSYIF